MTASVDTPAALRVRAAGDTHIGSREHNEDTVLVRRDLSLFLLADGAGGDNAGGMASTVATKAVAHHFEETMASAEAAPPFDDLGMSTPARRLSAAVHRANREIVELAEASDRYKGMGTTVVACFVEAHRGVLHLAHVGDSRCYRLRAGRLELLTKDHSLLTDVLELVPEIDDAKAAELPRAVVTRALGMERSVRVSIQSLAVAPGDRYLLCSDGLSDELDEEQIADALGQDNDPEANTRLLLDITNAAGAADNVAVVVVDIELTPGSSGLPRPAQVRPRLKRTRAPRPSSPDLSDPEIIIISDPSTDDVTAEEAPEAPEAPEVHAVPAGLGVGGVDAVRELLAPIPKFARRGGDDRDATIRFKRNCPKCGEPFDGAQDACPNCWQS